MEGVHVVWALWGRAMGVWETEVPQWVPGQNPGRRSGGQSPPEAEAKREISIQFLTFSCTKLRI